MQQKLFIDDEGLYVAPAGSNTALPAAAVEKGATFSSCRKYRFELHRIWDKEKSCVMFVGLNPSTANEQTDDATIRRVIGFAKKWGYGGVYMLNCFPFVSTNPDDLKDRAMLKENDKYLELIGKEVCEQVIFAWGAFDIVKETSRDIALTVMFPNAKALVINKDRSPRHPLYVPLNTELVDW